jgi:hypothetical protein
VTATSLAVALLASGASHFAGGRADSASTFPKEAAHAHGLSLHVLNASVAGDPPVDPQVRYYKAKWLHARARWRWMTQKRNDWRHYAKRLRAGAEHRLERVIPRSPAHSIRGVICSVFGAHCSEALRVAWCESRYRVHAVNGDYWGIWQFGSFARAHYGFAWNASTQTRAAYRYFRDAGWAPWSCAA